MTEFPTGTLLRILQISNKFSTSTRSSYIVEREDSVSCCQARIIDQMFSFFLHLEWIILISHHKVSFS